MDSGLWSGINIVSVLVSGVDFIFLGRFFVYGVGVLGDKGGIYIINVLMM